jgi:hypothetical protein
MNYQQILNVLQSAADECFASIFDGKGLFHYGIKEHHQQLRADQLPQIQVDPFSDTLQTDKSIKTIRIYIGFLDQDTNNSNDSEQKLIHFRMENLSRNFFSIITDEDEFAEITVNRNFIYRFSDACLTGVVCDFTINVPADLCFDVLNPIKADFDVVKIQDGEGNLIASVPAGKTFVIDSGFDTGFRII